ncbi:ABC transporter substrate-binding protein [Vibrio aestuarianus]|uniref:heme/hemin ABC transporter substrate-binding protein n=1 Tax=Vibrio aestuarianus TaxID=28171 RepID=UPI00237CE144|nr:ABC transporter substrate-binding protein [Vibrio aestuarianus]MDE1350317.1 ABC transporter substrate-binding protein [Vibrio aestuarianus]
MTHNTPFRWLFAALILLFSPWLHAQQRIISAGSAVTEVLLALGTEDQLVAVDVTSEIPPSLAVPKIGYHRQMSAEGLLALSPTLLLGSDEMGPDTTLQQLKAAGIKVEIVNNESSPQGLLDRIDKIATLTNRQPQAEPLKKSVNQQIRQLVDNKPIASAQKKVLFLLLHEGRATNVAGRDTTPNSIIQLAGAINPAADQLSSYKPLSMEAMIEMQPDIILVSGRSYQKMGGADAILKSLPMLAATPAGKNRQIITIDGHALVGGLGFKSLAEAKRLNALLYP